MDYINIAVRYIGEAEVDDATIQGDLLLNRRNL